MNKKILFLILLAVVLVLPIAAKAVVETKSIDIMAKNIADLVITIGTVIVVIGWIIAGILYLISGGSPEKTKTARAAVVAAVIGTVLIVIAGGGYEVIKGIINNVLELGK